MKLTVNFEMFCDAFARKGRGNNFSFEGQQALFNHLTKLEVETGEEAELDVISLCCDFSELHYEDIAGLFGICLEKKEEDIETVREFLRRRSAFSEETTPGYFIFAEF